MLLAFDWSPERIAAALSITPPTLRKYYFRELRTRAEARARVEAKAMGALLGEVDAGNVSAIDKLFKRLEKHDLAQLAEHARSRGDEARKRDRLGKKQQQQLAAGDVGGKFAPPAAPKRLN